MVFFFLSKTKNSTKQIYHPALVCASVYISLVLLCVNAYFDAYIKSACSALLTRGSSLSVSISNTQAVLCRIKHTHSPAQTYLAHFIIP